MEPDAVPWLLQAAGHEAALFAAVGLLIGGIDDLLVDLIWIARSLWRRIAIYSRHPRANAETLAPPDAPGRIAIIVGAWDESSVIGAMLGAALDRFGAGDYRIFVGTYRNDPATAAAVIAVHRTHPLGDRLRLVVGPVDGPTTKADNLNRLWVALEGEEVATGVRFKAIVLHDAEDVVHPAELRIFDRLIERFDLVQLPVLPLVVPGSRFISGSYADEFAEAHGKQLVVREAIGAGMPLAGTGCALSRGLLERVARARDGQPFDADSLTEDYEMGLRLKEFGGRAAFVRLPAAEEGPLVAVRAYFPATIHAAVRQKARWMRGIALAGWDRLGWRGGLAERWMRLRDRRAPLAAIVLMAAYAALLLWGAMAAWSFALGTGLPAVTPLLAGLCTVNMALLGWRVAMRMAMVWRIYGWREALLAPLRMVVGNIIAMLAARRAIFQYVRDARGAAWDKTRHHFPAELPAG